MDKAIAVIPARGGSKRIPRKNIKDFHGKPLIAYSIQAALDCGMFDRVVVSTDDEEIAETAKKYGAEVPFVRPKELADDFTGTADVVNHAVEFYEKQGIVYDYVCTIYATAPFIRAEYLAEGYKLLKNSDAVNAFSCASMPFPVQRTFAITEDGRAEMFQPECYSMRSQDLKEAYQDAGQFYWTHRKRQKEHTGEVMFSRVSIPVVIPRYLVQDIDTPEDWQRAELMYEVIQRTHG
ncbi:MAG: pseudaminic acid cytidylyltransferase [Deferribacterales bacterium]